MCGIAGFVRGSGARPDDDAVLGAMCRAIYHRGPDDEGRMTTGGVALGMRRLSIIDVAGGHQPISNEDGSVTVVFNGEIYNHHDLHARLARGGHRLATRSDTETLVHLYEDEGVGMLDSLRGMFAFAIWDARRQQLFVARDRLGIKPLYYRDTPDGVAFASELRAILADGTFRPAIDPASIAMYLSFGYVPDPWSVLQGVRKLPPAHYLTWSRDAGIGIQRYWSASRPELPRADEEEVIEELRRLLDDAVRCHLESEVPLGAFLSGGIDSSTVVALMSRAMDRRVQTFSIGFDESEFNEAPHAGAVASAIGTDHTELIVRPDVDSLVEDVVGGFDEPFSDSSALPTLLVSHLARQKVTVALSGDGGDELFGGYTRYLGALRSRAVRGRTLRRLLRGAALLLPPGTQGRGWLLNRTRGRRGRYAGNIALPLPVAEGGVALEEVARRVAPFDTLLDPWFERAAGRDFASQMMLVDLETYLPGDILTKVDRMSMAVSLEARVPLLDHHVVEFAAALPSRFKMRDGTGKWILRRAVEGLVPPRVLQKPKQGFALPLVHWFRTTLRHRLQALQRPDAPIREFTEPNAVGRYVREHLDGRRDHTGVLWRLMTLDIWLQCLARGDLARPQGLRERLGRDADGRRAAPVAVPLPAAEP